MKRLRTIPVLILAGSLCMNAQAADPVLTEDSLIYTPELMLNFDIPEYLRTYAPHLLPHADTIAHWAGTSTINPKVLIALMEQQSSIISMESTEGMSRPFGELSDKEGFREQMIDVVDQLANSHYTQAKKATPQFTVPKFLSSKLASQSAIASGLSELNSQFSSAYYQLFPYENQTPSSAGANEASGAGDVSVEGITPRNLLQLPYPVRSTWKFGGSHSSTGSGSVYSSIDFHNGGNWGDDLSNVWVTAAGSGKVVVHSSCYMEIIHEGGFSTSYYHLDNIRYSDGDTVLRDANIANYATNKKQALCEGGHSTGPHLHFSLKKDGKYITLQDARLSGFGVNVGNKNYDIDCSRFYLYEDSGKKHCAGEALTNPGVSDTKTTPTSDVLVLKNGVKQSGLKAKSGTQLKFALDVPAGATGLNFTMSGGSGDGDLYVKFGSTPTTSSYDCRPYKEGNNEVCKFDTVKEGKYHVLINAFSAFSGVSLVASFDEKKDSKPAPKPTPEPIPEPIPEQDECTFPGFDAGWQAIMEWSSC